jgi:hypothetical protein
MNRAKVTPTFQSAPSRLENLVITHIFSGMKLVDVIYKCLDLWGFLRDIGLGSSSGRSMSSTLLAPTDWAQNEFGIAQLGDRRRNRRLVKIATRLAANPGGTLPQAFPEWAELKAAYRFFEQKGVSFDAVVRAHLERTRMLCREPGEYLIIEDTTLLDYSHHPAARHLGHIGDGRGRGFELHSGLVVRVEGWNGEGRPEGKVMGLWAQECSRPTRAPAEESRAERLSRRRKSQCWAAGLRAVGPPPQGCRWVYVADSESDFYEPIWTCQEEAVDFIIRAWHDRRLAGGQGHLLEALGRAPLLGRMTVEVRGCGSQSNRTAIVEVRSLRVDLDGPWRPGGWQPPLKGVGVVEVKEVDAPEGVAEPLHWILLTSWPCETWAQARRVVGRYTARWWIEEYHKALKTGAGAEESQLEEGDRLEGLIGVLAVVAVRLLSTKLLARSQPDSFEAARSFGPEMLRILEKKVGVPEGGWTNRNVLVATARLGGFLARKHDGMPGWQTIWRGWQRLMWMCEGVETLNVRYKRCG